MKQFRSFNYLPVLISSWVDSREGRIKSEGFKTVIKAMQIEVLALKTAAAWIVSR